jgi:hypothetical protein
MKHRVLIAVILTWLLISFVPQLSAMSLLGKAKGKGKS